MITKSDKGWQHAGNLAMETRESGSIEKLDAKLIRGDYSAVDGAWQDLRIGGQLRRFKSE